MSMILKFCIGRILKKVSLFSNGLYMMNVLNYSVLEIRGMHVVVSGEGATDGSVFEVDLKR